MRIRFLLVGTLAGGVILSLLGWFTAAILPPRFKQFTDVHAVVETIRVNVPANGIYTAPQGLFVAVALRPDLSDRLPDFGARLVRQFAVEFAVALCLSVLLLATPIRSPLRAGGFLGLVGLAAGTELRFPEWNWNVHLLSGVGYLAANWCITGVVLGILRRRFDPTS